MIGIINKTITGGNVAEIQSNILKDIIGAEGELNAKLAKYLCVIISFGIPGNFIMIFLVMASKLNCQVQKKSKFYFVTLALANVLILVVILIPWVVYDYTMLKIQYSLISSVWFGKFEWFFEDSLICFINYLLMLMSIDRLFAIRYPFLYSNMFKFQNVKNYVYVIIVLSIIIALPFINYYQVKEIHWFYRAGINSPSFKILGNKVIMNATIVNLTDDVALYIHSPPGHHHLNVDPVYRYVFKEKMKEFSLIYDKFEAIVTNLIPCAIILASNTTTAILFYKLSLNNLAKLKIPTLSYPQSMDQEKSNISFSEKNWHSEIISISKPCASSKPYGNRKHPKNNYKMTFTKNYVTSIYQKDSVDSENNAKKFRQQQPKASSRTILRGSKISPSSLVISTTSSLKIRTIKARNRDFTILTGCLSLASLIFSLPWIIFIFQKPPTWADDILESTLDLQFFVYVMMYSQYAVYPYLIILTSPLYRKSLQPSHLRRSIYLWTKNIISKFSRG
ncbi:unnamed protein product [Gordionus sp. m RMFG-2023]